MAKLRFTGRGALVKANVSADGVTMVTIGLATVINPPGASKVMVDCSGLEDTSPVVVQGNEETSECTIEFIHDPSDTGDQGIETLYGNGKSVKWQVITACVNSSGTTKTWTKDFTAVVLAYKPGPINGKDPVKRTITLQRTGAITDTVA